MVQINYLAKTSALVLLLEQAGYCERILVAHKRCYDALQVHLIKFNVPFSMEAALKWLESRRPNWLHSTYCQYRSALYRLEKYLLSGSISCGYCTRLEDFACQSRLTVQYENLLREFGIALSQKCGKYMVKRYISDCKDFLEFLSEQGLASPTGMSIEWVFEYWQRVCKTLCSDDKKRHYVSAIVNLLIYWAECGYIPHCYSSVLPRNGAVVLLPLLKLDVVGTAFQPSKKFEPLMTEFLSSLDGHRYNTLSKKVYGNDLTNYSLFIEVNHLEYSPESVELWLERSPQNAAWERKRHTLTLFADFLSTGNTNKEFYYMWQPLLIDSLPDWSREIILGFVAERQRDGLARTTLTMCRSAGYRFFKFLDSKGVCKPQEITPKLVKEFHNSDRHSTPESKNAYGIKIRQLLSYMERQKLVLPNLHLAISTQCAPRHSIVSVLSAEMESAIYDYRKNASTPLELRNAAITMLGLRMGVRASDIVNLKISDFNWSRKTVSFVQKKTGKAITLPVPIDTANSVYKYIIDGRPQSGAKGDGYVFIQHLAPFGGLKSIQACRYALKKILSVYGMELLSGQGFHITRKTFATRLLTAKKSLDDISNALGHAFPETAEVYLVRDEENMRLCPLLFESVGVL